MVRMMYGEQRICLSNLGFLVRAQSMLFRKFGSALHWGGLLV